MLLFIEEVRTNVIVNLFEKLRDYLALHPGATVHCEKHDASVVVVVAFLEKRYVGTGCYEDALGCALEEAMSAEYVGRCDRPT